MVRTEATELVIFVASPSDVQAEREAVKSIAERIQNSLGLQLGLRIRFAGWEQVPPRFGRPQEQINPLVDACDVFIGILHARWGTESGTHSSGFIEEFERAVARFEASGSPAIAMFFKRVPQDQLNDAGPQLQRVLEFRERIEREHILLYCDVTDTVDFERQLTDLLLYHVGETASTSSATPASPSKEPPPESANVQASASGDQAIPTVDSTLLNEAQVQLLGVLDGYSSLIRRGSSRTQFDNDRLLLFACTVSRGPFLPTHEANRLYRRRSELALTIGEAEHWLRSMAADWQRKQENRTIPGWAIVGMDAIEENASSLLSDREAAVVVGSLELMTYFGIRPTALWPDASVEPDDPANLETIERWQSLLANPATAAAASAHLGALAASPDRPLLDTLNARISDDASQKTLSLICKALSDDFTDLISSTTSSSYLQQWQISRLTASLSRIDTARLIMLLSLKSTPENQALKHSAATQLAVRGEITKDVIAIALGSDDDEVAKIIIDAAWRRSEHADLFESAINNLKAEKKNTTWRTRGGDVTPRILAATSTAEELEASMELDANAWEARQYQKGIDGAPAARAVLSMRESEWIDSLPAPLRAALNENDLAPYVYARHITAAIRYLSQLPTHTDEDLDLIRTRVNDSQWSIQAEAADALARSGNTTDAKRLLDAVASANAIDRDRILHAALTLGGPGTIEAVASAADNATAIVVIPFLGQLTQPVLKSLLSHSVAKIRTAAADELGGQLNREQIESLLNEYTASASYFYNVAVALDSALYGPRSTLLSEQFNTTPDDPHNKA